MCSHIRHAQNTPIKPLTDGLRRRACTWVSQNAHHSDDPASIGEAYHSNSYANTCFFLIIVLLIHGIYYGFQEGITLTSLCYKLNDACSLNALRLQRMRCSCRVSHCTVQILPCRRHYHLFPCALWRGFSSPHALVYASTGPRPTCIVHRLRLPLAHRSCMPGREARKRQRRARG